MSRMLETINWKQFNFQLKLEILNLKKLLSCKNEDYALVNLLFAKISRRKLYKLINVLFYAV